VNPCQGIASESVPAQLVFNEWNEAESLRLGLCLDHGAPGYLTDQEVA
jgi:hypothetical protein